MHGNSTIRTSFKYESGKARSLILLLVLCGTLSSCGLLQKVGILSKPAPAPETPIEAAPVPLEQQPYTLKLTLQAANDLNPDTQSRPSPVQMRIFIAQELAEIGDMSFEQVFDLAGNVMDPRPLATITLRPGETKELALPANKSLTQLVVTAAYRDPYQTVWMARAIVTPNDDDTVAVMASVNASNVTINPTP